MLWTEKFRPRTINDIVGQPHIVATLKGFTTIPLEDIPHLMFIGPGGIGKTAAAQAFANDLGVEFFEKNGSSDRNLAYVQNELNRLSKLISPTKRKIIFLDEFDNVTQDAQFALRTIIEKSYKTSLFILSVNYPQKVIKEIINRTDPMFFNPLTPVDLRTIAQRISQIEGVQFDEVVVDRIARSCHGSARMFITQLFHTHIGGSLPQDEWDVDMYLDRIRNMQSPHTLETFYEKVSGQEYLYQLITRLTKMNFNDKLTEVILKLGDYLMAPNVDDYSLKLVVGTLLWRNRDVI